MLKKNDTDIKQQHKHAEDATFIAIQNFEAQALHARRHRQPQEQLHFPFMELGKVIEGNAVRWL